MASQGQSFREFETAGWENADVCSAYDEHLSVLITQLVDALLDAARMRSGSQVLDVAAGAGYVAGTREALDYATIIERARPNSTFAAKST